MSETYGYTFNVPNTSVSSLTTAALWSFIDVDENTLKRHVWGWDIKHLATAFIEAAIRNNLPGSQPYTESSMLQSGINDLAKMLTDWRTVQSYKKQEES